MTRIKGCIASKPVIPIIENFRFIVDGNNCYIAATDLTMSAEVQINCDASDDVSFCIEAKPLLSLVKDAGNQPIAFEVDEKAAVISIATGNYELPILDTEEFPTIPNFSYAEEGVECYASNFLEACAKVSYAVGHDELRPAMMGVCQVLNFDYSSTFYATNGYVAAKFWQNDFILADDSHTPIFNDNAFSCIWPASALKTLASFLKGPEIKIVKEETHLFVCQGNDAFILQKIAGEYPNVESIILSSPVRTAMVRIPDLQNVLYRMQVVSSANIIGDVHLTFNRDQLIVKAEASDVARFGSEVIDLVFPPEQEPQIGDDIKRADKEEAKTFTIFLSCKHLMTALDNLSYPKGIVRFYIYGTNRQFQMCSMESFDGDEASEVHLIMPISQI